MQESSFAHCVPISKIEEVISEGCQNEAGQKWNAAMSNIFAALDGKTEAEAEEIAAKADDMAKELAEKFR